MVYKSFVGFDTETFFGYPYLVGCYDLTDNKYDYIYFDLSKSSFITDRDIIRLLSFLTDSKFSKSLNTFHNMRFDIESIIKFITKGKYDGVPLMRLKDYANYGLTYVGEIKIKSMDNKVVEIGKNKFYDTLQYYNATLRNVAKKYLDIEKIDFKIGIDNFKEIKDNLKDIIEYHKRDCEIQAKITEFLYDSFEKLDISFNNPISMGYVAVNKLKKELDIHRYSQIEIYEKELNLCYRGGMFDIWKRGYFPKTYIYDINSAYPYVFAHLLGLDDIDSTRLKEYDDKYDYSYYRCIVDFKKPFKPIKHKGKNYYCIGEHKDIWLSKNEILMLDKLGWKYEIIEGIGIYCFNKSMPYKDFVYDMYKKRLSFPKVNIYYYLLKILLNAISGKTRQSKLINKIIKLTVDDLKKGDKNIYQFSNGLCLKIVKDILHSPIYNPLYAQEITEYPRLLLLKYAYENYDDVISLNTDSIVTTKPIHGLELNDDLGNWKLEFSGKSIWQNNGIYCIYNDKMYKEKVRGFFSKDNENINYNNEAYSNSLINLLKTNDDFYITTTYRMVHCNEAFKQKSPWLINIFSNDIKVIDINSAHRRIWERDFESGYDMLEHNINSKPFNIKDIIDS